MIKKRLKILKKKFNSLGIDGYVDPKMMSFFQNILAKIGLKQSQILVVLQDMR